MGRTAKKDANKIKNMILVVDGLWTLSVERDFFIAAQEQKPIKDIYGLEIYNRAACENEGTNIK